ncbi:MAG: ATP-binding protein, partial [Anaerolineales bacterium]
LLDFWATLIAFCYQWVIKQASLQLEREQNQRKILIRDGMFDSTKQGILVLGNDLSITEINSSAEIMLGYAGGEVIGQAVENVLIGPDGLMPALAAARHGIPTHNLGTVLLHRRNGQAFPSHVEIIPVLRDDETMGIIVLIEDISENEQIRLRTQQLEHRAVLGEFTAVFAHEVRNPINNISTGLQLLAETLSSDDPGQEVINRMLNDCNRLNHLMESVLSFSRPMDTRFERVDLPVLVRRVLDRWRPRLAKVGVELFYQAEQNLPAVRGDPRALEQVFTNLISNAVEAMSKSGGHLAVRVLGGKPVAGQPQIEVTVSDDGPGIPEEIRERIFEPFVTANARGTGLGLAITKQIITAHRGSITVNTFPGGTMFQVCLPAIEDDEQ